MASINLLASRNEVLQPGAVKAVKVLDQVAATGASSVYRVPKDKVMQVDLNGGTGTVTFQGSNDQTAEDDPASASWVTLGSALSADGYVANSEAFEFVRANVTAYTSGNFDAWIAAAQP